MLPCFLRGLASRLLARAPGAGDDFGAGIGRLDDGVNIAAFGGDKGIGEAVAEFGDFLLTQRFPFAGRHFFEFTFVNYVHYGAFRSHDSDFCSGPREVCIGTQMLGRHYAVGSAVGLACDDGDFRYSGFGEGEQELRAMFDDAAQLLLGAGKKAGDVFKGDQWNVKQRRKNARNVRL